MCTSDGSYSSIQLSKVRVNYTYVKQKNNNFLIAFLQDVLTFLFLIKGFKMFNRPEHGKTHLSEDGLWFKCLFKRRINYIVVTSQK